MLKENLKVKLGSLQLRNPIILAAGILGLTGGSLRRVWRSKAGAVTTKSVGTKPRKGYPGPRVVETSGGLLNAMGLPNPGIKNIVDEIKIAKKAGATVIGSVFGNKKEEFASLAQKIEKAGADAIELNLSCPHAETLTTIGHDPELTKEIIEIVTKIETPIWVKLPGNTHLSNLTQVAKAAEVSGAESLVLSNTFPGMTIDIEAGRPILGHETGGLSGPAIKPIGLRLVYEVSQRVEIPIIGAGGIRKSEDAIEYILAGASAVEVGTGIMQEGLGIFQNICGGITSFLEGREMKETIGLAHQT